MKCGSCGGDNAPALARCQYCDQALAVQQAVDVAWLGRAQGVVGRGRLSASALGGTEAAARLRSAAEDAFAGAIGELGPSVTREQLAAAMRARLATSSPGDELASLTVDTLARGAAAVAPGPPSVLPRVACLFVVAALGGCCLLFGVAGLAVSSEQGGRADRIEAAVVVTPEQAKSTTGLVVLEAQPATVGSAVEVAGTPGFMYLEETELRTTRVEHKRIVHQGNHTSTETWSEDEQKNDVRKRTADGLRVGGLLIAQGAEWDGVPKLPELDAVEEDGVKLTRAGVAVGARLTAVGVVHADGTLGKGGDKDPFLLSTRPTRAELVAFLREQSVEMRRFGIALALIALVCIVGAGALALASRRT